MSGVLGSFLGRVILEQTLREKKLWNHVMSTSVPPSAPRVRAPGIAAVAANPILMIAAMARVAEITQEQVDSDDRKLEDYEASVKYAATDLYINDVYVVRPKLP